MEEKTLNETTINYSSSDWSLKRNILRNARNYRQLENRLIILDLEKQKKIKSIEKKLAAHKKKMQIKMSKFQLQKQLQNSSTHYNQQQNKNSRIFREIRINRMNNIQSRNLEIRDSKHRLFKQIKLQREMNEKMIKQVEKRELSTKTEKRNHVRLIEIESRQNVINYWNQRIDNFRQNKRNEIIKKMNIQQQNMTQLLALEKCQNSLLNQIKQTQEMESKLVTMMEQQLNMVGHALVNQQ